MVKISTENLNPIVIGRLKDIVKQNDFKTITEERATYSGDEFIYEYWKDLSNERYHFISITFFYSGLSQPQKDIEIEIENELRGQEPHIKVQIDEIGDILYEELSRSVGKDKVNIERKPTSIPLLY